MRLPLCVFLLAGAMAMPALAGDCEHADDHVVIRDTQSRYAVDGDRYRPLTSTFLDTTSTRLIDARRGFRPYSTIHRDGRRHDRFVRRSFIPGYSTCTSRHRAPRTGVTTYGAASRSEGGSPGHVAAMAQPIVVVVDDRREAEVPVDAQANPPREMRVTVYEGEPTLPERSGAVIVRPDGTVISVGE